LTHPGERRDAARELRGGHVATVAVVREERKQLDRGDPLVQKRLRQLFQPLELRLVVFVRAARRPADTPGTVRWPLWRRGTGHVAVAGAGVVDPDPIAVDTAQELVERDVQRLAQDVPEGDVDGRKRPGLDSDRAAGDVRAETAPMPLDPEWV